MAPSPYNGYAVSGTRFWGRRGHIGAQQSRKKGRH